MNFSSLRYALRGLSAYRTLLDDENESILDYATTVLYTLANGQKEQDEEERAEWGENALSAYACLFQALCDGGFSGIGDWLWDKLRYTETPFALSAQSDGASPALEQAARRELWEESGAAEYDLVPLCDYWAGDEHGWATGQVFVADVWRFEALPESEMVEIRFFDTLPENLTYPDLTPKFYEFALKKRCNATPKP